MLVLGTLGRHAQALAAIDALLAQGPPQATDWLRRGLVLQRLERHAEALPAYERAPALDPTLGRAHSLRGGLLKDAGHIAEAAAAFEQARQHGDDPELNRYLLASVRGGQGAPPASPPQYLEGLFGGYAPAFDDHLVQVLHCRASELLAARIGALASRRVGSALYLGCGTGLLGPHLASVAAAVDGVDLVPAMLQAAATRAVHRHLVQGEITRHLVQTPRRFGLVAATDVFIDIGDLDPVFAGVRRVLEPGGLFAFTVERGADGPSYELRPSSRYAHPERYPRALAGRHGFDVIRLEPGTLREEQRQPIEGLIVVLRRGRLGNHALTATPFDRKLVPGGSPGTYRLWPVPRRILAWTNPASVSGRRIVAHLLGVYDRQLAVGEIPAAAG